MNQELFLLQIVKISIVIMGSILTWLSLKGYTRTKKKGHLFLAMGFAFLTAGSGIEGILFEILHFELLDSALIEAILVAIGFLTFIYAVYGDTDKQRVA